MLPEDGQIHWAELPDGSDSGHHSAGAPPCAVFSDKLKNSAIRRSGMKEKTD